MCECVYVVFVFMFVVVFRFARVCFYVIFGGVCYPCLILNMFEGLFMLCEFVCVFSCI